MVLSPIIFPFLSHILNMPSIFPRNLTRPWHRHRRRLRRPRRRACQKLSSGTQDSSVTHILKQQTSSKMKEHIRKSLLHALDMWEIHDLKLFSCLSISHVQVG